MRLARLPATIIAPARKILIEATRCWRQARDAGQPVQPSLTRKLSRLKSAILAPVLDSLLKFYESALGRQIQISETGQLSDDEAMLLMLIIGTKSRRLCIACSEAAGAGLDRAIRSAQVMLGLAIDEAPAC